MNVCFSKINHIKCNTMKIKDKAKPQRINAIPIKFVLIVSSDYANNNNNDMHFFLLPPRTSEGYGKKPSKKGNKKGKLETLLFFSHSAIPSVTTRLYTLYNSRPILYNNILYACICFYESFWYYFPP